MEEGGVVVMRRDTGLHTVKETVFILQRSRAKPDNHHHVQGELTGVAQLRTPTHENKHSDNPCVEATLKINTVDH